MKCPSCGRQVKIEERCYRNLDDYSNGMCIAHTACCGVGVYLCREVTYKVVRYDGTNNEDDWGIKISHPKLCWNGKCKECSLGVCSATRVCKWRIKVKV